MVFAYFVMCGFGWGLIGYALARDTNLSPVAWTGLAASPAIGVAIGWLAVRTQHFATAARVFMSLANLYVATTLFGLAVGIGDMLLGSTVGGSPPTQWAHALMTIVSPAFGFPLLLTVGGYVLVLWPLSYANHLLIWRLRDDMRAAERFV